MQKATVKKINNRFRVVGADGAPLGGMTGKPVDGGGHRHSQDAHRQAEHINAYYLRKERERTQEMTDRVKSGNSSERRSASNELHKKNARAAKAAAREAKRNGT